MSLKYFHCLTVLIIIALCTASKAQNYWIAEDFPESHFLDIHEVDNKIIALLASRHNSIYEENLMQLVEISLSGSSGLDIGNIASYYNEPEFSTSGQWWIPETRRWISAQIKDFTGTEYLLRLLLLSETFEILDEIEITANGRPVSIEVSSTDSSTFVLGYILYPEHKLFFTKYEHDTPNNFGEVIVRQSSPTNIFSLTSMDIIENTHNMVVFSADGIAVLDTSLNKIADYWPEINTSDHGSILNVDTFFYSHGGQRTLGSDFRKLVLNKYDQHFNILKADTFGLSKWDNYPFTDQSIDIRNDEILIGGHLDGPANHFNFDKVIKMFYLAKYDLALNQIWYREFGGDRAYIFARCYLLEDGSTLAGGFITDPETENRLGYILRVDKDGLIVSETIIQVEQPIRIQNPSAKGLLEIQSQSQGPYDLRIIDPTGKLILTDQISLGFNDINMNKYSSGLYYLQFLQKNQLVLTVPWVLGQ